MFVWGEGGGGGKGRTNERRNRVQQDDVHRCEASTRRSASLTLFAGSLALACGEDVLKYAQRALISPLPLPPPPAMVEAVATAVVISPFAKATLASGSTLYESGRAGGEITPGKQASKTSTQRTHVFVFLLYSGDGSLHPFIGWSPRLYRTWVVLLCRRVTTRRRNSYSCRLVLPRSRPALPAAMSGLLVAIMLMLKLLTAVKVPVVALALANDFAAGRRRRRCVLVNHKGGREGEKSTQKNSRQGKSNVASAHTLQRNAVRDMKLDDIA